MKTRFLFVLMAGMAMFFAACSETGEVLDEVVVANDDIKSVEAAELVGDSCDFSAVLTEDEIAGLMLMREEEKFAHDVYITFYESYGKPIFKNISNSEAVHTKAILYLLNGFGLADPAVDGVGNFKDELFTGLYNSLTEKGSTELAEALKVGALIEEIDIKDLEELIEATDNETIKRVYGNLLRGSTFHLKAFTAVLKFMGETYTPTIISQEEYDAIVNSSTEDDENDVADDDGDSNGTFVPGTGACDGTGPNA